MCALSAVSVVTSGRIQSVKADLQVTDRCDGRQVQCTARAQLRNGRVQVLQGIGKKVLLFFSFQCPLYNMDKPQSKQSVNYSLTSLSLNAQSSSWKRKQLCVFMLYVILKIFTIFKGIL